MKSFTTLSFFAILASVFASPIEKRAGQINCDYGVNDISYQISLSYATGDGSPDPVYYFGTDDTTKATHNGQKVPVLISTLDDGSAFTKENAPKFDLQVCSSSYMGTMGNDDGAHISGLLRPAGDTANCVQTKTGSVDTSSQVMVVAPCSLTDDASQQQQTWSWDGRHSQLTFLSTRLSGSSYKHPTFFTRSNVNHHALKLNAGELTYPYYNQSGTLTY